MKEVFISYTTHDLEVARSLMEFLETSGIQCFFAPRDIGAGNAYASALMKALEECKAVLLVASDAINSSEHVLNEVDVMIEMKKPILPVFIEDFHMNYDYRYYLGRKQCIIAYPDVIESYFPKILDGIAAAIKADITKIEGLSTIDEIHKATKTVFEYNADRGIMINPEDHQRNVSFRTDTFINMMGGIYDKVKALVGDEEAEKVFFESGYASGKNFGERIDSQWNTGYDIEDIKTKIKKWCQFDSAVGWGKFSSELSYDEEKDDLTGTICINEAFIVDAKNKRKICNFIRGYCTGVVETLLGSIEVELTCRECPYTHKFKNHCLFDLKTK